MYDTPSELLKQIPLGEDSILALRSVQCKGNKVTAPHRDGMADELAAMANTASGIIVLGVDDKTKQVMGIEKTHLDLVEEWVRSLCTDLIDPPLDCVIRKLLVPGSDGEEKAILRIDVPRSLFVHKSPNGYFRRVGSSKREIKPDALARLFQQRSQARIIRFDEQTVPGTSIASMNPRLWQRFRTVLSPQDDRAFLENLKLIASADDGTVQATVTRRASAALRVPRAMFVVRSVGKRNESSLEPGDRIFVHGSSIEGVTPSSIQPYG